MGAGPPPPRGTPCVRWMEHGGSAAFDHWGLEVAPVPESGGVGGRDFCRLFWCVGRMCCFMVGPSPFSAHAPGLAGPPGDSPRGFLRKLPMIHSFLPAR